MFYCLLSYISKCQQVDSGKLGQGYRIKHQSESAFIWNTLILEFDVISLEASDWSVVIIKELTGRMT